MSKFTFQPRWKEELVVSCNSGQFILELSMGILTAYFPTEHVWEQKSPTWATNDYAELKSELQAWCLKNNADLIINDEAGVNINGTWA